MAFLRFPFSFSQPTPQKPPPVSRPPSSSSLNLFTAAACTTAVAAATGATAYAALQYPHQQPFLQNALGFLIPAHSSPASICFSVPCSSPPMVESKFPSVIGGSRKLLGVGKLRWKAMLGLKNTDVYEFGVYADEIDAKKQLKEKYGKFSTAELKERKEVPEDLMESDICMTVRLQIVYKRLSIQSVRSEFEESVGNRLQKFGKGDNKELLHRFTSQFKDECKIQRGSVIEISRDRGHVLRTIIDEKEVGRIKSKLLCRSILDLYIGENAFDQQAKEDVKRSLASLLQ